MNEKIKKLVEQCTTVEHGVIQPRSRGDVYHFDKEKFAELIVQECGIVADKWVDDEDNGKNLVSEKLKQHFGVK